MGLTQYLNLCISSTADEKNHTGLLLIAFGPMGPEHVLVSPSGILWRTNAEGAELSNCAIL